MALAVVLTVLYPLSSHAQTTAPLVVIDPSSSGAPKVIAPPAMSSTSKVTEEPLGYGKAAMPEGGGVGDGSKRALTEAEDKASSSVEDVAKHIGVTDSITVEDLNAARQAVARIDALIDIEKHLIELEKVRSERDGGKSFAAAIPASALKPVVHSQPAMNITPEPIGVSSPPVVPMSMSRLEPDIILIVGADHHYSAMVKGAMGPATLVRVGDRLDNGGKVVAIEANHVEIEQNGARHTLNVKNVDTVFNGSP
jgi:type IV pilus biogenesis protein PilP